MTINNIDKSNNINILEKTKDKDNVIHVCKWCTKKFKKNTLYKKHETKQICRSKSNRTYCEPCDITFESRDKYNKHLVTRTHIDSIVNDNKTCKISGTNITHQISSKMKDLANMTIVVRDPFYMLDPYLTEKEAEDISIGRDPIMSQYTLLRKDVATNNIDRGHTTIAPYIYINNNDIDNDDINSADRELYGNRLIIEDGETLEEKHNRINEESKTYEEREIEYRTKQPTEYSKILEEMLNKPEPTDRQRRILEYLNRYQEEETNVMTDRFKLILAALKLGDANYLRRHILEAGGELLSLKAKQIYVGYLDVFIDHIVSLSIDGTRTHLSEGVPFDKLVINLTR